MKLILIGGQSRSGKSEISNRLAQKLGKALVLNLDDFYNEVQHAERHNFDVPAALDKKHIDEAVTGLLKGEKVKVVKYDFATRRLKTELTEIDPAGMEYLIVDGIFSLTDELDLRKNAILTVYVDTRDDIAVARRFLTDQKNHGRTVNMVFDQLFTSVMAGRDQYIKPTRAFSDVVISNNTNDGKIDLQPILDRLAEKEDLIEMKKAAIDVVNSVKVTASGWWNMFAAGAEQVRSNVESAMQSFLTEDAYREEDAPTEDTPLMANGR